MPERIALDVHAHLAPINPQRLEKIDGVFWREDEKALVVDGHVVGVKSLFKPEALFAWMDENNVSRAWISIPPPLYRPQLKAHDARLWTAYVNDGLAEIAAASKGRLDPLVHLPLQDPALAADIAGEEIEAGRRRFGAAAGGIGDLVLSDRAFHPLWKALDAAGAFVFFHPGECADGRLSAFYLSNLVGNPYETTVAIAHLAMGGILEKFDRIRFCFAHGGGAAAMFAGRLQRGFDSARPGIDTTSAPPEILLRNICVDCITHNRQALDLAEKTFGETGIVFGSDWPFPMGLVEPHRQLADMESDRRARIFCDNPELLLRETKHA